jgi:hypothetical protein
MNHNKLEVSFALILCLSLLVSIVVPLNSLWAANSTTLISQWKLDEAAPPYKDSVGNNDASCKDANSCPMQVTGRLNKAQLFDGSSKGLDASGDLYNWNISDSFTISYWMKRPGPPPSSGTPQNEVIVGREDRPAGVGLHWWVGVHNGDGKAEFILIDENNNFTQEAFYLLSNTVITDDNWHHVAAVRDGVNNKNLLYVDGELEASVDVTYTTNFTSSVGPLNIGYLKTNIGPAYHYEGTVDDVRIYAGALSNSEIKSLFTLYNPSLPLLLDDE